MIDAYQQTIDFLEHLDPSTTIFTFQTFDDNRDRKDPKLIHRFIGTISEHYESLAYLNELGACISVSVQPVKGGRKKQHVQAIRAVFFEDDNDTDLSEFPICPTMQITSSPGRKHLYYRLSSPVEVTPAVEQQFKQVMKYMTLHGSDKQAIDITKVLRIPGFRNNKYPDRPLVTLDYIQPNEYSWFDLVSKLDPDQRDKETDSAIDDDDIEFFSQKVHTTSSKKPFKIALVASALKCIDPDIDRQTWMYIGMSIHNDCNGSEDGYNLFHQWSRRGDSYKSTDWPKLWNSFGNYSGKEIEINYLYKIARDSYKWDGHYNADLKNMGLLVRLERKYAFEHMNRYYALLRSPTKGLTILYKTTDSLHRESFDLVPIPHCNVFFGSHRVPTWGASRADGSRNIVLKNVYSQWFEQENRREYSGLEFKPSPDIIIDKATYRQLPDTNSGKFNTYLGLHNKGKRGDWSTIQQHIWEVWSRKDDSIYEYILNWLARVYQYPGEQGHICLVLKSDKFGAGKTSIIEPLIKSFGRHGHIYPTINKVTGKFNAMMAELVFCGLGEAIWTGSPAAKSVLYTAISDEIQTTERKHHDQQQTRNYAHIIAFGNRGQVVPIEPGDRRFQIIDCSNKYAQDFKYFKNLTTKMRGGETDAFIWHLRHRDITDFEVREIINQKGVRAGIMEFSLDSVEAFVLEALTEGSFTSVVDLTYDLADIRVGEGNNVDKKIIYGAYVTYYDRHNMHRNSQWKLVSKISFGMRMKRLFPDAKLWKASSVRDDYGLVVSSYKYADIQRLRRAYDQFLGAERDWDVMTDDDDDECLDDTDDKETYHDLLY